MRTLLKRFALLLTVCMLLVPFCVSALHVGAADAFDGTQSCSLTVNVGQEFDVKSPEAFTAVLYRVADLDENGELSAFSEGPFAALADYMIPEDGKYKAKEMAQKALEILYENYELLGGDYEREGLVGEKIEGLEPALYLVLIRKTEDEEGLTFELDEQDVPAATTAQIGMYAYTFSPSLVRLPDRSYDGEGNPGDWVYNMTIAFKGEQELPVQKDLTLHKVAAGEEKKPLPGAKFELYATRWAGNDIPSKTITAYVEGKGFVTLYCMGEYETDAEGNIVAGAPVLDDSTLYAWVETQAPDGYKLDPEPHFFFAYGDYAHPSYLGDEYHPFYEDWLNAEGEHMATRLRYSANNKGNDVGMVSFNRTTNPEDPTENVVTITNNGSVPLFVKIGVQTSAEYHPQREEDEYALLTEFTYCEPGEENWTGDGYGNYSYCKVLYPGETTDPIHIKVWDLWFTEGDLLPYAGRYVITYDYTAVHYHETEVDDEGNPLPYADYDWDPRELLPGEEDGEFYYEPLPASEWGVKVTGRPVKAQRSDCKTEQEDSENGLTVTNDESSEESVPEGGLELPETGGSGTAAYYIAGSGLVAIALFLFAVRKRKRTNVA